MFIRHKDIEIPLENPFANCKLGREKYAKILTSIVDTYSDGFVLAVNNEWGTGKTTFVKMWQQQLENQNFKTRYFNAWENDYDSNPLAALISELKMPSSELDDKDYSKILKKGAIIAKSILPAIVKAWAKRHIDVDELTEVWNAETLKGFAEASTEILKEQISEYEKKKNGLGEFRKEIESYISKYNVGKPLVFIIDELDRCRPDYAVEVLELVKHFFNVHGIVFVLSIDKIQLGHAVRGFYGSDKIDSEEYLRRFIDIEYVIPPPLTMEYCEYLYDYYKFDDFFNSAKDNEYTGYSGDKKQLLNFATTIFENGKISLRKQERIFAHARMVLNLFEENKYDFPAIYIFLVYIRFIDQSLYKKIKEIQITPSDLFGKLRNYLPSEDFINERSGNVVYFLALFIHLYNNSFSQIHHTTRNRQEAQLFSLDSTTNIEVLSSEYVFEYEEFNKLFLESLVTFKKHFDKKIKFLFEIVDLTENLSLKN